MEEVEGEAQPLRSIASVDRVHVCFVNLTSYIVEIIWVNYSGQFVRYHLLRSRTYVDIDTYKTHPWIARHVDSKDRLCLNDKLVYVPPAQTNREREMRENLIQPVIPQQWRDRILITLPMYTLRERTLLYIRNFFQHPEQVNQLALPKSLLRELKAAIQSRNTLMNDELHTA